MRPRDPEPTLRHDEPFDIAILGAGASGTLVAAHLLARAPGPLSVLLLERGQAHGVGVAYGTRSPSHLLNVPAGRMSALPDDPGHFLRWLAEREPGAHADTFAPRQRYGEYLQALLAQAEARARPGVRLERRAGEARALEPEGERLRVRLADGSAVRARRVVLALGNEAPAPLRVPDGGVYASPAHYAASPWTPEALAGLAPDAEVLLLGTGLTAVDVLLSLRDAGHRGVVHALSRHALLPRVHRTDVAAARLPLPETRGRLVPLLRAVRRHLHEEAARGGDWRAVLDALRPHVQRLWGTLAHPERQRFLRHLRTHWDVHRHRTAPEVGAAVQALTEAGRLVLHAGRVRRFALEAGRVRVDYAPRGARGEERSLRVDRVINCTGPAALGAEGDAPLVRDALAHGLVRPDALGLGLEALPDGTLRDAAGAPSPWLFSLGPLLRGQLWETTAVPEIREQARALAERLLRG